MKRLSNLPPGVTDNMVEEQAWQRFEIEPSYILQNTRTGQKVSPFGAVPWYTDEQKKEWKTVHQGWTIRDNANNTVGCGRPPWKTEAEAQEMADKWNSRD